MRGGEMLETFDCCRHAVAYLRSGRLLDALRCFERPWIKRLAFENLNLTVIDRLWANETKEGAATFIGVSLLLSREGLLELVALPKISHSVRRDAISPDQFCELERLARRMILAQVKAHWKGHLAIEGEETTFDGLKPHFSVTESTISNKSTNLKFADFMHLDAGSVVKFLGRLESASFKMFCTLCELERAKARGGESENAGTCQRLDFGFFGDALPPFDASLNGMPDYMVWAERLIAAELVGVQISH